MLVGIRLAEIYKKFICPKLFVCLFFKKDKMFINIQTKNSGFEVGLGVVSFCKDEAIKSCLVLME